MQTFCNIGISLLRICKVHCYQTVFVKFPHCPAACFEEFCHVIPCRFAGDAVVCLISDLNHADIYTSISQGIQAIQGKLVNGSFLFFDAVAYPRFGCFLLFGVCPEIRVVEVNQNPHPCACHHLSKPDCFVKVIVSAAVSIAAAVIGVIPDTDTYPVHAAIA